MEGSSNSSFIPKRGPVNRPKKMVARQVYLFTVFSYVIFFAALSATAGIFFYEKYVVDKGLQDRVQELESQISLFKESEMEKVKNFDARLLKVTNRVENSVSLGLVFAALEDATAQTVSYESLAFERMADDLYELDVTMYANSFDSAILQRNSLERDGLIATVDVTEVNYNESSESDDGEISSPAEKIDFSAVLTVPVSDIPFEPPQVSAPAFISDEVIIPEEEGILVDDVVIEEVTNEDSL